MVEAFGDADVMRFSDGVQSAEWVLGWVRRCLDKYDDASAYAPFAVVEKSSGQTIGYCGLSFYPDVGGRPEIELGYRLIRSHWGRGYATEAATAIRDYSFGHLGLKRLIAPIDPGNAASIRVAKKLGMHHENDIMLEGYTHPDRVYVISVDANPNAE